MISSRTFEFNSSVPLEIKGNENIWEGLNKVSDGILEEIAQGCITGDFPGLFLENEQSYKKGLFQTADLFTTDLRLNKLPEKPEVDRVWRDALWYKKNELEKLEQFSIIPGPPKQTL